VLPLWGEWHSGLPFLLFSLCGRVPVLMEQFMGGGAACFVLFGGYFSLFSSRFWIVALIFALAARDSTRNLFSRNGKSACRSKHRPTTKFPHAYFRKKPRFLSFFRFETLPIFTYSYYHLAIGLFSMNVRRVLLVEIAPRRTVLIHIAFTILYGF
jgi:hypothetical protein